MKKFAINLFVFVVLLVAIDQVLGLVFGALYSKTKDGHIAKDLYVTRECDKDIVIFGSSRALHHYVPSIIQNQTGLTTFNAGRQGHGVLFSYGEYLLARKHHIPRIAIIDIYYEYDLVSQGDYSQHMDFLKPYYSDSKDLQNYFKQLDSFSPLKMCSRLYRFNSQIFAIAKGMLLGEGITSNGYTPLDNSLEFEKSDLDVFPTIDSNKVNVIKQMISLLKNDGVKVILVSSPMWYNIKQFSYNDSIAIIAKEQKVDYIDFSNAVDFDKSDFYDNDHLNANGANKFSTLVSQKITPLPQ